MRRTPRKWIRWPRYIMRPCINSHIDLTLLHICLHHITRLGFFYTSEMLGPECGRKCQLAPRRQYISSMEWIVYFSRGWFVDFSAISLQWDDLFWLVEQTALCLFHRSCLEEEKQCLQCRPQLFIVESSHLILPSLTLCLLSLIILQWALYLRFTSTGTWREAAPAPLLLSPSFCSWGNTFSFSFVAFRQEGIQWRPGCKFSSVTCLT